MRTKQEEQVAMIGERHGSGETISRLLKFSNSNPYGILFTKRSVCEEPKRSRLMHFVT